MTAPAIPPSLYGIDLTARSAAGVDAAYVARAPSFQNIRKALANLRAGVSDARIFMFGDSTTWGFPAGPTQNLHLINMLTAAGYKAYAGLAVPPSTQNGSLTSDPRYVPGAGWILQNGAIGWANNSSFKAVNLTTVLTYTPGTPSGACDTFDVFYAATGGSAPFTIQATGGALVTVTPGSQNGIFKVTCTAGSSATTNVLTVTPPAAGTLHFIGAEARSSTEKRLLVANAGVSSSSTGAWNFNTSGYQSAPCIAAYAPDLAIGSLGLNDSAVVPSIDPAVLLSNLKNIFNAMPATTDGAFWTPPPPTLPVSIAPMVSYQAAYAALPGSLNKPIALIDVYNRWGPANTASLTAGGWYRQASDLHPSQIIGYNDIAKAIADFILRI